MTGPFDIPTESDLITWFGGAPIEREVGDGRYYWCYEYVDTHSVVLRFSFDLLERSVQTRLSVGGVDVASVSHELAQKLWIQGTALRCEFVGNNTRTTLVLELRPQISVKWSTLQTGD